MKTQHFIFSVLVGFCLFGCLGLFENPCKGVLPNGMDRAHDIVSTQDGGFVVVGQQENNDPFSAGWLIKLDKDGHKLWERVFKKPSALYSVVETSNGDLVLSGTDKAIKLDKDGNHLWERTFGVDNNFQVLKTTNEEYVLATINGFQIINSDDGKGKLIKIDKNGNILWKKNIRIMEKSIVATTGGDFLMAGYTKVMKLDKDGHKLWEKTFTDDHKSYYRSIIETSDGNFVLAGNELLIKLDKDGKKIWSKNPYIYNSYLLETTDKGLAFLSDSQVMKLDKDGHKLWEEKRPYFFEQRSFTTSKDGGIVITGYIKKKTNKGDIEENEDIFVIKLDKDGKTIWEKTFGGTYINCKQSPFD